MSQSARVRAVGPVVAVLCLALPVLAASKGAAKAAAPKPAEVTTPAAVPPPVPPVAAPKDAVAVMQPTEGNHAKGVVRLHLDGDKLLVVADLEGLNPGQKHGFHIHEFGDCSKPDGSGAGGHFNPGGHQHGLPDHIERHAGDLGNVTADAKGAAHYEITVSGVALSGKDAILGRGLIVHAKIDDGGQPTGNAGGRIACGTIGLALSK